ncbi:hypothetical protein X011_14190 [Mycobacterium tuberculosis variant microti OV254]|nr:hypothetical protein X011_14190 [Mycobacterium tuberculosis variant microti OV254]
MLDDYPRHHGRAEYPRRHRFSGHRLGLGTIGRNIVEMKPTV